MLHTLENIIITTINTIIFVFMCFLTIIVFANVVMRYGFNSGIASTVEITKYLFVWIIFLGAISAMKRREHIAADVLKNYLASVPRIMFAILGNIVVFACCLLILKGCWDRALLTMGNHSPITRLPIGILFIPGIIAGAGIGVIAFARSAHYSIRFYRLVFKSNDEF